MRIAVISDIHGNLLALDAVMTDIENQEVDQVWCAGDVAYMGPWASECIARVRGAGWPTVRGNTDVWITGDPQTLEDPAERARVEDIAAQHAISPDDAAWLAALPLGHTGPGSILMVHGTPSSPFVAPGPRATPAEFAPYQGVASLIVCGHAHQAFVRRLPDGTLVVNAGSVGMPMDGPGACYVIIETSGPEVSIVHRRITYDRRGTLAQARVMGGVAGETFVRYLSD